MDGKYPKCEKPSNGRIKTGKYVNIYESIESYCVKRIAYEENSVENTFAFDNVYSCISWCVF